MKKYAVEIALLSIALLLLLVVLIMPRGDSGGSSGFNLGFGEYAPEQETATDNMEWNESDYEGRSTRKATSSSNEDGGGSDYEGGGDGGPMEPGNAGPRNREKE